jgi:hypothetical protein
MGKSTIEVIERLQERLECIDHYAFPMDRVEVECLLAEIARLRELERILSYFISFEDGVLNLHGGSITNPGIREWVTYMARSQQEIDDAEGGEDEVA